MLLVLFSAALLVGTGTACKKKHNDHGDHKDDKSTKVEGDFKPPKEDTGDVLSKDLKEISEKYLHDIHFDFDKSDIREGDRQILTKNADVLKKYDFLKVRVEGHCDERGSVEYNLALGERRAKAAYDYLVTLGVPAGRLKTVSYGKEVPLCQEHGEECWARNRRAHFTVEGKTTGR